jgi:hypothetical protein
VTEKDLTNKNASLATPADGIRLAAEADRVLTL